MADTQVSLIFIGVLAGAVVVGVTLSRLNDRVEENVADYVKAEITKAGGTFGDVAYDAANNVVTISALAFAADEPLEPSLTIDKVVLTGADPDAIEAVKPPVLEPDSAEKPKAEDEAAPEDTSSRKLFDSLTLEGVTVAEANGDTVRIASAATSDVRLKPLDPRPAVAEPTEDVPPGTPAETEAEAVPPETADPLGGDLGETYPPADGDVSFDVSISAGESDKQVIELLSKLEFSSLSYNGLVVAAADGADRFAVGGFGVEDYSFGDVGAITIEAVDGSFENGKSGVSLGKGKLDYAKFAGTLASLYAAYDDDGGAATIAPAGGETGGFFIESLVIKEPGGNITLDRLALSDVEYKDGINTKGRLKMTGLAIPLTAIEDAYFRDLGYDELRFNLSAAAMFDPDLGTYSLPEFYFEAAEMGALDVKFDLSGFGFVKKMMTMTPEEAAAYEESGAMAEDLSAISLKSASLRYNDLSFVDRLMTREVAFAGVERTELVSAYVQAIDEQALAMGLSHPFITDLKNAVFTFLLSPRNISFKASPAAPVSFADVGTMAETDPNAAIDALGLGVSAND